MRYAESAEVIAILRALAVLNERTLGGVRISEPSRRVFVPGSTLMHLNVECERDEFWRIVAGLRQLGAIHTERLFQKHRGPGEVENIAQDSALEFFDTVARCVEAGHRVEIVRPHPHDPREGEGEAEVLTFTVRVPAQAFYGLRPHQF